MRKFTSLNALFILLFLALIKLTTNAQSTSSIDTICSGSTNKSYKVVGTAGNTYTWSFSGGGTKTSGGNTDSITVDWSSTPGIDTLTVVESNAIGCFGDPIQLVVVRLAPPTVILSGTDSICLNTATVLSKLQMNFTGYAPWIVNYTEAGTNRTVTTSLTQYNFNSQVFTTPGIKTYAITSLTDRFGCTGTYSGSASVTVFPKPTTSAIIHY
jgi:hypothetical protein